MGHSRRERLVALTKTRKHVIGKEKKQDILEDIRSKVDAYEHIYVFSTENMRNAKLKNLRVEWKDSRFFFGRKRIAQVALGRRPEEEYADGLRKVSEKLSGNVGLLFTNRDHEDVVQFFQEYSEPDFARSGFVATGEVKLAEGVLEGFEPSQESNLRLLGLPVGVRRGKVVVLNDFTVCESGDVLTPERAKLLELLGMQMAQFRVLLQGHYCKSDGMFQELGMG